MADLQYTPVCSECSTRFKRKVKWQRFCCEVCRDQAKARGKKKAKQEHRKKFGKRWRSIARARGVEYESVDSSKVFARDGWRCQICGTATPKSRRGTNHSNAPQLDHRIPISKGGPHTYANIQCACRRCNMAKGNKTETGQLPLFSIIPPRCETTRMDAHQSA